MEQIQKQIESMSVLELKALAYDTLSQIQYHQQILQLINQQLAKTVKQPQPNPNE